MEAGDPTQNTLQKTEETLNRAEKLSNLPAPSQRVETPSKVTRTIPISTPTYNAILPRVQALFTLDKPTSSPRPKPPPIIKYKDKWKRGMQRITQTRYNLRDGGEKIKSQVARQLLAQHTFKAPKAMHIYDDNVKR